MARIGYINCKLSTVKLGQTERHLLKLLSLHADIVCNSFLFCGFDCDRNQTELVLSKRALAKPSPAENLCSILSITQLGSRQDDQVQQSIDSEMSRVRLSLSLSLSVLVKVRLMPGCIGLQRHQAEMKSAAEVTQLRMWPFTFRGAKLSI